MVLLSFASCLLLANCRYALGLATPDGVAPDLISISGRQRSQAVCCSGNKVKSCVAAAIHPDTLGHPHLTLPTGAVVEFKNNIAGNMNAYHYESEDAYAIIVYSPSNGAMHGHAKFSKNTGYSLEYCGEAGHVWKEMDMKNMKRKKHDGVENKQRAVDKSNYGEFKESLDNTTMVTYSVKFYYTDGYGAKTADIPGQVELYVAETNQGYANSLVPLKVEAICIERASLPADTNFVDSNVVLDAFNEMKSSYDAIRGSADVAHLMVADSDTCGLAFFDTIWEGQTLGLTDKNCALDNTIGHEIGHNIGLAHDPAQGTNEFYSYGTGHQIAQGKADKSTAYHTIMAYDDDSLSEDIFQVVVPYYSHPNIIFPKTGTPTGKAGVSFNAAVLLLNRFALAQVGDESATCTGTTLAPPTTAPSVATTTPNAKTATLSAASTTPGATTTTPGATTTTPSATTTTPGATTTPPSAATTTVSAATTTVSATKTAPSAATTTPGATTTTPGATTTPEEATTNPGESTTTPEESRTTPGSTETAPPCKPCKDVLEGELKGTYTLLRSGDFRGCPADPYGGCVYVRDGLEYCFKKGGVKINYC